MNLYNKYRPHSLKTVCGQEHIKKSLTMMIRNGDIPHSFLFTGPAGTGKTTVARILAAMLNCSSGVSEDPPADDHFVSLIVSGRSNMDVLEMDAASNRGIDDVKSLREKAYSVPMEMRRKVYIIDECHQLTPEAWNALLKIIEEPPAHAIFVLCTTERRKVIQTIQSRCVCFEFRTISVDDMLKQLRDISGAEKIDVDDDALRLIACAGRGSLRTAISKLERLRQSDERITPKFVSMMLGVTSRGTAMDFFDGIITADFPKVIKASSEAISVGVPVEDFLNLLSEVCHDLAILDMPGYDLERTRGYMPDERNALAALRDKMSAGVGKHQFRMMLTQWIKCIDSYVKYSVFNSQPQLLVDTCFIRIYLNWKGFLEKKGGAA